MITLITFNHPCDAGRNITETSGFTYKSAYSHDLMELLMAVTSTALRSTDAQTNTLTETINSLYLSHKLTLSAKILPDYSLGGKHQV